MLADVRDKVLYGQCILWGKILTHDILPLAARRQLEADDVCAMEIQRLHRELILCAKEHGDNSAVCTQRLRPHDPVSNQILRIYSLGY